MKPSLAGRERNEMKLENAGKKEVVAAKVAIPGVYHEGSPPFLWTRSVFYLIKVAPAVSRPGKSSTDLHKLLWKIGGVGVDRIVLPDLNFKVRREMVDDAKAVISAEPKVNEKILAEGLAKKYGIPAVHVLGHYGIVRQAAKELAEEPDAIAAVRKHLKLGGEVVSDFKMLADRILRGPAKPAVTKGALTAACWQLKKEIEPYVEAAADAIVRKYLDDDGTFAEHAKELGPMVMNAMKPEGFDWRVIQAAAFRLIPGHKADIKKKQGSLVEAILYGCMGKSGGKSGATIGDALKFQAEGKPGRDRPRKGGHDHRRDKGDDEGRGGGKRR